MWEHSPVVMNILKKGVNIIREESVLELLVRSRKHIRWKLNPHFVEIRTLIALFVGELKLTVNGTTSNFVALNKESVRGNLFRFQNENDRIKKILNELKHDDIFYDIGANTGLYTCFASKYCNKVIAFEPYPPNISELEKNSETNGDNILVLDVALSDSSETVGFMQLEDISSDYPTKGSPGFGRGSITKNKSDFEVRSVRGDELIENGHIPNPNVVKIDVEGAEPLVLKGLEKGLSSESCRAVFCEVHRPKSSRGSIEDHGFDDSMMINKFQELGFDTVIKHDDGSSEFLIQAERKKAQTDK